MHFSSISVLQRVGRDPGTVPRSECSAGAQRYEQSRDPDHNTSAGVKTAVGGSD